MQRETQRINVAAALIIGVCYIAIKLETHGPAFFVQVRPGYHGKLFKLYELRSMIPETERDGVPLTDMERITKTGAIIRKLSLDELPQIFNIIKGDMSFIGPRPLMPQYLERYSPEQARRHEVRPGISGWAQCHGRNAISWTEKFRLDVWYVDHCTFLTDVKIIFLTIKKVVCRADINTSTGKSATMEPFNGKN